MHVMDELASDPSLSSADVCELQHAYHQAMATQLTRTWLKVAKLYMKYICTSSKEPLHHVVKFWWRFEYQDASGNLPHIHCLLWTTDDKHNPCNLAVIQCRIRCSTQNFIDPAEAVQFVLEGLLDNSTNATEDVLDDAQHIL